MANVPYDEGVASVAPEARAPDDYQRIQTNPAQFGGAIAQGEQKLGQGLTQTSDNLFKISEFYGKVNSDYEGNNFIDARNRILYGQPGKMITGPDGSQVPDTGFMGLTGRAAADAREGTLKALQDERQAGRSRLQSPMEQLEYDNQTRRIYAEAEAHIGEHADTQWKTWAGGVNDMGATHALSEIARAPDDAQNVAHAASDLINFRVQQAQLKYGDSPEIKRNAIEIAKRDALKAQLESISAKDPARALSILDKNKNIAGVEYEQLYDHFRGRAEAANGTEAANEAIRQAGQTRAQQGPVAPASLKGAILGQESGGNPNAPTSVTGAVGPMQIQPATFKQFAQPGEDIGNAADNMRVGGRIIDQYAQRYNGDAARVAVAYFSGPGNVAPAGSPTPWIRNVSDPNGKSVSSYVNDVQARLGGEGGQATTLKADAYKYVMNNPNLNDNERQHAFARINQVNAAAQVAADTNEKAKRELSDTATSELLHEWHAARESGDPQATQNIMQKIWSDPRLTGEMPLRLQEAIEKDAKDDVQAAAKAYGPGFWTAYKAVSAPVGDPGRISDMGLLLGRAGPGGDLTLAGVSKLREIMQESRKSVEGDAVNRTKLGLLNYAKGQLSFEADTGPIKIRDPKGEEAFNARFLPAFESAYDQAVKDGKDPWQFLTKENVDKIMAPFKRPQSEMNRDKINAVGESIPGQPEEKQEVPQAPTGVDPAGWVSVITRPPLRSNGAPWQYNNWSQAVEALRADPSEINRQAFDKHFAPAGITSEWVLSRLQPKAETKVEAKPVEPYNPANPEQAGPLAAGLRTAIDRMRTPGQLTEPPPGP